MTWDLLFTLPNLAAPNPTPYVAEGVCLCAADDDRLQHLAASPGNDTARLMLNEYRTYRGEAYLPACLLVDTKATDDVRNAEALRAFRNACAVATTTFGTAVTIIGGQWVARWSDHFLFGFFAAGQNGWVGTLDGASQGTDDELPLMQSNPAIGRPSNWSVDVDEPLCGRLLACWRQYFLARRNRRAFRRLFRSLEVAFHAGQFPSDGLTSINDVGTRIGLWVSAFEVLCHPGNANVNLGRVLAVLNGAPLDAPAVAARRYRVRYGGQLHRVGVAGAVYSDLYNSRNRFMHGNPVSGHDVRYRRRRERLDLLMLAPIVFNVALLSFLHDKDRAGPMPDLPASLAELQKYLHSRSGLERIQNALNGARYDLDQNGRPQVT